MKNFLHVDCKYGIDVAQVERKHEDGYCGEKEPFVEEKVTIADVLSRLGWRGTFNQRLLSFFV